MVVLTKIRGLLVAFTILLAGCAIGGDQQASRVTSTVVEQSPFYAALLDSQDCPTAALASILARTSVTYNGTLPDLVAKTQKQWLRSAGKERWQATDRFADKREQLLPLFAKVGVVDEVKPSQRQYDYAVLLGATVRSMRNRLAYLAAQWQEGVRFGTLVFLVGARVLDPAVEDEAMLLNLKGNEPYVRTDWHLQGAMPTTEAQAARMVYDQLAIPDTMRSVPVLYVDTPMQRQGVIMRRPNTADTVIAWLATKPQPGSCLVVSNQPYVIYQDAVMRSALPSAFTVETIGAAAPDDCFVSTYLDTIARFLFTMKKVKA